MEDNGPQGVTSLNPKEMVDRIIKGTTRHCFISNICGPKGYILNTVKLQWLEL